MDSAFAKLGRAKVHRDQLRSEVNAYRAREPIEWMSTQAFDRLDPNESTLTVRVHIKEEIPAVWGLIIGDVLTNLRATLDHAVFGHAAAHHVLTEAQQKKLQYPVLQDVAQWLGAPAVAATPTSPPRPRVESARRKLANFLGTEVLDVIAEASPTRLKTPIVIGSRCSTRW